ncbi:hypothetical protein SAMN05216338_108118 [Bradyrhizobium sp. Rc2d]|nr:hypothetical protein SAMN05216338_108118 [Bradyrhizobium sp. Rc2d]
MILARTYEAARRCGHTPVCICETPRLCAACYVEGRDGRRRPFPELPSRSVCLSAVRWPFSSKQMNFPDCPLDVWSDRAEAPPSHLPMRQPAPGLVRRGKAKGARGGPPVFIDGLQERTPAAASQVLWWTVAFGRPFSIGIRTNDLGLGSEVANLGEGLLPTGAFDLGTGRELRFDSASGKSFRLPTK